MTTIQKLKDRIKSAQYQTMRGDLTVVRGKYRRTYNFPSDEIRDERTGMKVKGIRHVLDGNIEAFLP